jgi:hypothetical protein
MPSALFRDMMQRTVIILYRRFGTTYRSHLQGPRNPIGCSENLLQNYYSTLLNIAEERRSCHIRFASKYAFILPPFSV